LKDHSFFSRHRGWMRGFSVCFALLIWQIAAMVIGQSILLASPTQVLSRLAQLCIKPDFWAAIGFSLSRILGGFGLGLVCGTALALAAGKCPPIETLLWPFVLTVKTVPVASFIIISLIWLTARELNIFIAFLMVFHIIYTNVLQGIRATDPKMVQMAALYHVPWNRRLWYLTLPQLKPYLLSACSVSLGLAWKAGIAAEVIGIPAGSIGERLYESKVYLQTADLLAWTVAIVVCSIVCEKLILRLLRGIFHRMEVR